MENKVVETLVEKVLELQDMVVNLLDRISKIEDELNILKSNHN